MAQKNLFRKDIEPRCQYCAHGLPLGDDSVACRRFGVVSGGFHCRKFKYNPLRRVPPKPSVLGRQYESEDFLLEPVSSGSKPGEP